jgi:hypothetical protein
VDSYTKDPLPKALPADIDGSLPGLSEYKMPDRGKLALFKALVEHSGHGIVEDDLVLEALQQASSVLEDAGPHCFEDPDYFTTHDLLETLYALDPTKSSGFPATLFAPNKGQVFNDPILMDDLLEAVMYRTKLLVLLGPYCHTPDQFHACFLADIMNINIKDEPVKVTKEHGRIVCAPGIVTVFIECMLYRKLSTDFKNQLYESYSGIGIGFDKYHSYLLRAKHIGLKRVSDVPKFDATVALFEAIIAVRYLCKLAKFGPFRTNLAIQLERAYYHKLFNVFGDVYRHEMRCWQPSGRWATADLNTLIRSLRAVAAALLALTIIPQIVHSYSLTSVGDDCTETDLQGLSDCYEILGFPLRDVEVSHELALCSHVWLPDQDAYSKRIFKSLYSLLLDPTEERVFGFVTSYRSHPHFGQLIYATSEIRPEVNMYLLKFKQEFPDLLGSVELPIGSLDIFDQFINCKPAKKATKPQPKRATRTAQLRGIRMENHDDTIIGLTDPFSGQAANARYPDQGSGKTLTFQQRMATPLTSSASGTFAFAINPKVNFPYIFSNTITGSVVTWPATYNATSDFSTNLINTYGKTYRPTSVGLRITNLLSATNSSGYVVIAKGGPPVLGSTTTFNPANFSSWDMHSYVHGGEWHTTAHPRDSSAYEFGKVTDYNTNTQEDVSWETVYVFASGLPNSTSSMMFELFINYEYTALEDAPIAQLAQPQPILDINMQTAINAVQNSHPPSHKGSTEKVKGFIKREAKKALLKHVLPFAAKKATQLLL